MAETDRNAPSSSSSTPNDRSSPIYDDEISLIDLWRVLERRRWWLFGIALVVIAAGVIYAVMQTPRFAFETQITVPSYADGTPLIDLRSLQEETHERLVPELLAATADTHATRGLGAELRQRGSAPLLVLSTTATQERAPAVEALHSQIIDTLILRIEDRIRHEQTGLAQQWEAVQRQHALIQPSTEATDEQEPESGNLEAEIQAEQLRTQEDLLRMQLEETRSLLSDLAARDSRSADARSALLLHQHELQQMLLRDIPSQRSELITRLLDRGQAALAGSISTNAFEQAREWYESRLERHDAPQAGEIAVMSSAPAEDRRDLIIALSIVLGLMLGVFGAFFREFLANVRAADNET